VRRRQISITGEKKDTPFQPWVRGGGYKCGGVRNKEKKIQKKGERMTKRRTWLKASICGKQRVPGKNRKKSEIEGKLRKKKARQRRGAIETEKGYRTGNSPGAPHDPRKYAVTANQKRFTEALRT